MLTISSIWNSCITIYHHSKIDFTALPCVNMAEQKAHAMQLLLLYLCCGICWKQQGMPSFTRNVALRHSMTFYLSPAMLSSTIFVCAYLMKGILWLSWHCSTRVAVAFGAEFWALECASIKTLCVAWRKGLTITIQISLLRSSYIPSDISLVYDKICKRSMPFIATSLVSSSQLDKSISSCCIMFGRHRLF